MPDTADMMPFGAGSARFPHRQDCVLRSAPVGLARAVISSPGSVGGTPPKGGFHHLPEKRFQGGFRISGNPRSGKIW